MYNCKYISGRSDILVRLYWYLDLLNAMLLFLFILAQPKVDDNVAKIWTLSAQDIDDKEVVSQH